MSGETSFDADFELDFNPAPSPTDLRREKRVTGPPRALLGVVRPKSPPSRATSSALLGAFEETRDDDLKDPYASSGVSIAAQQSCERHCIFS